MIKRMDEGTSAWLRKNRRSGWRRRSSGWMKRLRSVGFVVVDRCVDG